MEKTERRTRRIDAPVPKAAGGASVPPGGGGAPAPPSTPTPGAPRNLRLIGTPFVIFSNAAPQAGANLAWSAPVGSAPDRYRLEWATDVGFTSPVARDAAGGQTTMTVDGLPVGITNITVYFRIAARVGGVYGAWSNVVSAVVTPDTAAPDPPTATSAAFDVAGTLEVRATPPAASANFRHVRVEVWNAANTVQLDVSQFAGGLWTWSPARNRQQTAAAGLGTVSTSVTVRLYAVSWGGAQSSVVTHAAASAAPTSPTGLGHSWSGDTGTAGADLVVTHAVVAGLSYYLSIDTVERLINAGRHVYTFEQNAVEHAGTADPVLSLSLVAENALGQRSPAATATATNAAPPAVTLTVFPAVDRAGLTISPSAALDLKDYRVRAYLNGSGTPAETFYTTDTRYLYQATAGSGSYQFDVAARDVFGQVGTASSLTTAEVLTDFVQFVADLREDVTYTDSIGSSAATLAPLKDEVTGSGGVTYASSASAWRWTMADRKFKDRHRYTTVALSASTPCYLGTSPDGVTWTYHYGGSVSGGVWTPTTTTGTEATAQAGAVALNGVVSIRLGATVEARYIRLGHRNTGSSYVLREFYPRSLVTGDDILAQSITSQNLAAGAVVAGTIAAGALDAFTITGATIRTNATTTRIEMSGTDFRVINAGVTRVQLDTTGLKTFDSSGNVQVEATTATDGALRAGGANAVQLDKNGIAIAAGTGFSTLRAYKFTAAGYDNMGLQGSADQGLGLVVDRLASGGNSQIGITAQTTSPSLAQVTIGAFSLLPRTVQLQLAASGSGSGFAYAAIVGAGLYLGDSGSIPSVAEGDLRMTGGLNVGSASGAAAGEIRASGPINPDRNTIIGGSGTPASRLHVIGSQLRLDFTTTLTDRGILMLNNSGFPEIRAGQVGNYGAAEPLLMQQHGGLLSIGGGLLCNAIAAPATPSTTGQGVIYIDTADGDLKIRFANGTLRTIATN